MKNILITGSYGQLGNEINVLSKGYPQFNFLFTDVDSLDICNKQAIEEFCTTNKVNYILNCAAYTAVDKAEEIDQQAICERINAQAVKNIGEVGSQIGAKIIHISTDYVFDGTNYIPYTEDMKTCPTSVYGKTKLEGENLLKSVCKQAIIIRTSWLYSSFGNNFVKTMIKVGKEKSDLNVIFDQIGTPTYAADLADSMLQIIDSGKFVPGIYHFSNEGVCSWYDFTKMIFKLAHVECEVLPIESKDYAVRTPRPHYSVLNKSKLKSTYNQTIPYWMDGLERCLHVLLSQSK